jgi:hypothetical protein
LGVGKRVFHAGRSPQTAPPARTRPSIASTPAGKCRLKCLCHLAAVDYHVKSFPKKAIVVVDYAAKNGQYEFCRVLKHAPKVEKQFGTSKPPVRISRLLDETPIKAEGQWKYLYRLLAKATVDFLMAHRRQDHNAAHGSLKKRCAVTAPERTSVRKKITALPNA